MREMFGWVDFFSKLAARIDEEGPAELNERARGIDWRLSGRSEGKGRLADEPLFGVNDVDPLTFFSYLATRTRYPDRLPEALANVGSAFGVGVSVEHCEDWKVLNVFNLLVAWAAKDRELLWMIFRQAVAGQIEADTFRSALELRNVALPTLSTILFLINPRSFLPLLDAPEYRLSYGLTSIPPRMPWNDYSAEIGRIRAEHPGCEFFEIELFHRLMRGGGEAPPLVVHPERCWVVSTNMNTGIEDLSTAFHRNYCVRLEEFRIRGGRAKPRPLAEPEPGDLVLLRFGRRGRERGRGIGVVYRNDYENGWAPEHGIHVLWLNKKDGSLETEGRKWQIFEEAAPTIKSAFRECPEYARTWEALERMAARSVGTGGPDAADGPKRYWLMSLGRKADLWSVCYESGTASIGFDHDPVGDLGQYRSQQEVGRAMGSESGTKRMHDRLALWEFSHVMKPGDVIFVKRGRKLVVGHGVVRSRYRYDATRERHRHVLNVDWNSNFPAGRQVRERPLVTKTLTNITEYPELVTALKAAVGFEEPDEVPRQPTVLTHSRNQILYGPPGTGKTYETVSHALAIVDGIDVKEVRAKRNEDREAAQRRFRQLRFKSPLRPGGRPEGQAAMVTFHQNYAYEDFVEGIRPKLTKAENAGRDVDSAKSGSTELAYELRHGIFRSMCDVADNARRKAQEGGDEPPRYVLIIDEINRGNIPKIFGELITLIEPSRRLGADDETMVALPYSGDNFGVPDNLYIIGTMNTADRSIQQMDTALRRRFTFVEMMPDANHDLISEDVDGVNCRKMLKAMNERIALLLDREHQIGHTYLLNVETMEQLADTFRNRIFPLLQEYFYDDWRKIRAVLGNNAFVRERRLDDPGTRALAEQFGHAEDDRVYERLSFSNDEWKNSEQYKRISSSPKED